MPGGARSSPENFGVQREISPGQEAVEEGTDERQHLELAYQGEQKTAESLGISNREGGRS